VWGLDIVGPFPHSVGGYWFLYVVIDKFTKWPEATLLVKINKQFIVKFIKSIIYRFGVPNRINTDNEFQFTSGAFQGYCEDLDIQICYASVAHPESNGQVECANVEILNGIKTRTYDGLKKHAKKWIDELPCALWGNRTSPSRATGETETPFFMVYGADAVLPSEVIMGSLRVKTYDEGTLDQLRREDIDLVDERRWQSAIKNARYRQALKRYHQRFVRSRELQVDDLVLWQVLNREGMNKLSPCPKGLFRVTQVCRPGCVRLAMEEGESVPRPWNTKHLRKCNA
jgi:transposase InsO family protein